MPLFFIIFFTVYFSANFYIFLRGWQALPPYPGIKVLYAAIFIISASAYILTRAAGDHFPALLYDALLWIGSLWFAFMLYFFLWVVAVDLLRLVNYFIPFFPEAVRNNYPAAKMIMLAVVIVSTSIIVIAGYINTRIVDVKTITITAPKKGSSLNELNIAVASDFHLTPINDGKLLKQIVGKINALNPDIILLPGDIVDDKAATLDRRNIGSAFELLKAKYGIFASNGNHEFITGVESSVRYMERHGITVLRDTTVKIAGAFYLAGREDRSKKNFTAEDRKSISEVLIGAENDLPLILLDHTPLQLEEAMNNGVTLQLSGHTHHGQLYPINFITSMIYEVSWGYLKKGDTHYYVTSGAGTWGPPVRTGSRSEIVNIIVKFN